MNSRLLRKREAISKNSRFINSDDVKNVYFTWKDINGFFSDNYFDLISGNHNDTVSGR